MTERCKQQGRKIKNVRKLNYKNAKKSNGKKSRTEMAKEKGKYRKGKT